MKPRGESLVLKQMLQISCCKTLYLVAREEFVSRMSHENRSPLCAVRKECDLLGDKHDLPVIKDSCAKIWYIADDVLSLYKVKSKSMVVN